jgi:hypothetical protein
MSDRIAELKRLTAAYADAKEAYNINRTATGLDAASKAYREYARAAVAALPNLLGVVDAAQDQLDYMDACNDKGDLERNLRRALAVLKDGAA